MFDIGFPELVVVSIIALLVLGPERLPEALRTMGLWLGRLRRSFNAVKTEIEQEIGMDEIRRQLHNEAIMEEMQRIEAEVNSSLDTDPDAPSSEPNQTDTNQTDQQLPDDNSIAPPTAVVDGTTDTPDSTTPSDRASSS